MKPNFSKGLLPAVVIEEDTKRSFNASLYE